MKLQPNALKCTNSRATSVKGLLLHSLSLLVKQCSSGNDDETALTAATHTHTSRRTDAEAAACANKQMGAHGVRLRNAQENNENKDMLIAKWKLI